MQEALHHPAVQAGVIPFAVALGLSFALVRTRLLALAQVAGFLVLVGFAVGFGFESLTATRKLVLIVMGTGLAAVALEWRDGSPSLRHRAILLVVLAASCVWMLWRLLAQLGSGRALVVALLASAYVVALVESTLRVSVEPVRGAAAGLVLGLGAGVLAILGASALLGQLGVAAGVSAGATLLAQVVRGGSAAAGTTISLPASTIAGLAGVLSVLSASLPWPCLVPIVATPWATRLVPQSLAPLWLRACLSALAALLPMVAAVGLAWVLMPSA